MKPPVKPDNIPNPPEGFTYAGRGCLLGTNVNHSQDIAMWIASSGWDIGNLGNGNWIYAVRTDSPIHQAQPWYRRQAFERLANLQPHLMTRSDFMSMLSEEELEAELERRRKPKTITINGIEVPEPLKEAPKHGDKYYTVSLSGKNKAYSRNWLGRAEDVRRLSCRVSHLTEEAAIKHAEALISFTKQP